MPGTIPREEEGHDPACVAVIERYIHEPDECTIFPDAHTHPNPSQDAWISAKEGSFYSLAYVR